MLRLNPANAFECVRTFPNGPPSEMKGLTESVVKFSISSSYRYAPSPFTVRVTDEVPIPSIAVVLVDSGAYQ